MRMEARDAARANHGSVFKAFPLPSRASLRDPLSQPDSKFLPNKISGFACPAGNASCALNYSPEVPCPEGYRAAGEPRAFGSSANGQWRGLVPPLASVPQKPRMSRGSYLEARKNSSGTSNSFVGKSNHHCHASAFPIKPAQSPSWSGPCRRSLLSPKKTPRRFISTAEETVREEEREIYRQLLQMVTGKQFSTSKPSSLFPFHLSRCSNSSKTVVKETPSKNSKLFEAHSVAPASSATGVLGAQEQPSHKPSLYSAPSYPSNIFESSNSTAQHQQENLPASNTQSEGSDSVILLKVKDSRTPAPSLPFFQAELWIKELTSVYDSRARERWRQIEEQKALALQLQSQRLQEQEHSVQDLVDLNLRVPLEKEIPVTVVPEEKEDAKSADGEEEFPEITEEMEKEIKNVFRGGNQDEVLSEAFRLTITRKDIQTLNNLNWLNDEIINFYMNLLMERSKEKGLPAVHAFNTFFFTKLKTAGYQAVKRWTKKVDIFSVDLLLVPIHLGVHWCLAVVDFRKKTITYYDSMGGINSEACRILLRLLLVECSGRITPGRRDGGPIHGRVTPFSHRVSAFTNSKMRFSQVFVDQISERWHISPRWRPNPPPSPCQWYNLGQTGGNVFGQRRWADTHELSLFSGSRNWNGTGSAALLPLLKACERQYLKQESLDKKRKEFDTNGWSLLSKKSQEIPQQMNGSDCGMFACKYADCITKDKPINFTQQHMPYFRKRMAWEILHRKLL